LRHTYYTVARYVCKIVKGSNFWKLGTPRHTENNNTCNNNKNIYLAIWNLLLFFTKSTFADRITTPMIIGEISVPLLYRQNYLADDHRRDFRSFIIQTELPHRCSSAKFSFPYYADRNTSPMNIGEIFVPLLYRQNYLADDHRRDFHSLIIQTELLRRWSSARFSFGI